MIEAFPASPDPEVRLKRARMRAWRRGMREMDLILGGFVDSHASGLTEDRLDAFEAILARRDQDLYDWISGRREDNFGDATLGESALLAEIRANWRIFEKNSP